MKAKQLRVLNLGAGVQSTAIYLMMIDGEIPMADVAIFADTGDEPQEVYEHLSTLEAMDGPPITRVATGNLGDNLLNGVNSDGQRFIGIPTFMAIDGEANGVGKRQCTNEYKIKPIEKEIRRILGVEKGKRIPKGTTITQVFGLSFDEPRRVGRVANQFRIRKQWHAEFPLFDEFITRQHCIEYLAKRLPGRTVPRSACVFCPYKSDAEWQRLKDNDKDGWKRAVEIDNAIRDETSARTRGLDSQQFLHRSCQPLELVQLNPKEPSNQKRMNFSQMDCEGMCGV